ncbi:dTDP-4-dehydrorhamnose 3,5-epimerase [Paenibacillus sp. 598K]|uniref:dTDP-4-dehydrorhamnose 3,5-epimerase n=1 Tax=Paenibacillus sp. 598K TaxID=1117987 RepID=UPI000FF9BA4E|nr:dTDP-4-dehydrorhamnose 3,5-epimerase [Paenibacillus sp. 598K]GBF75334.1 dTDP-4-dehydrorhamnose 3,5-epimerase [Paenibacillus sp. 598K]
MNLLPTGLEDVLLIETARYGDHRGYFEECYNAEVFARAGLTQSFVQDNHSYSADAGTVRGLHYQRAPKAQTKLVRVGVGAIYDVAVDIRLGSKTYGHWVGVILSESNGRQLLVPAGFAHGFCTLVPGTHVYYKVDALYDPQLDRGILWSDPALGIDWPVAEPTLSAKDLELPSLEQAEAAGELDG